MKVIQKNISYSSSQIKKLSWFALGSIGLLSVGFISWLFTVKNPDLSNGWKILFLSIAYIILAVWVYFVRYKFIDSICNNILGKKGEDLVSETLKNGLDDRYTYIRNFAMFYGGDIDGILIGPSGIFILEVKYWSGKSYEIRQGIFYRVIKNRHFNIGNKPFRQIIKQKDYLLQFFNKRNVYCSKIRTLIVLAHGHIQKIEGNTHVYVVEVGNLINFLNQETQEKYSQENLESIADVLK